VIKRAAPEQELMDASTVRFRGKPEPEVVTRSEATEGEGEETDEGEAAEGERKTPVQIIADQLLRCAAAAGGEVSREVAVFAAMDYVQQFVEDSGLQMEMCFMPVRKKQRSDGTSVNVNKQMRQASLTEDINACLMRLQMHGGVLPQFATLVNAANRVMRENGDVAGLLGNMQEEELSSLIGTVSHTTLSVRRKNMAEAIYKAEHAILVEMDIQLNMARKMLTSILEMAVVNEFADVNGATSWLNFTTALTRLVSNAAERRGAGAMRV
jgi:hypothetical protein